MAKQTVLVTALPDGVAGGTLRLSVFFSPRLEAEASGRDTLGQWPDWSDWPSTDLEFKVLVSGSASQAGVRRGPPASPALWRALFPPHTPVRPYAFTPLDGRRIRSFPVRHIVDFVRQQWTDVAVASPDQFPATTTLLRPGAFGPLDYLSVAGTDRAIALTQRLERLLHAGKAVDPQDSPDAELSFFQARDFHRPVSTGRDGLQVPQIDFHQMVTALLAYPRLLRELGLVHDLVCDLPPDMPALGTVRVEVTRTPQEPAGGAFDSFTVPLETAFDYGGTDFRAHATDGTLQDGYLVLKGDPQLGIDFDLVQIDVDGAAMSATSLAADLRQRQHRETSDTPQRALLPALRSAGISLTRHGRAARHAVPRFAGQTQRNASVEAGQPPSVPLRAQDLVRGYAVDVWDSVTRAWHQLSARHSRYAVPDGAAPVTDLVIQQPDAAYPDPEESGVTMAVTESADPDPAGGAHDLYLRESLFRWDGWSLAARRPGHTIGRDGDPAGDALENPTAFRLETAFRPPPGSLPALRFGRTYHVRARTLDLAGNGPRFDAGGPDPEGDGAPPTVSRPILYSRFEPVSPPTLLPRRPISHGESLERLVIRSNHDAPAAETTQRHVVPPRAAQLLAEQHGVFDGPGGVDGSQGVYDLLVARDGDLGGQGVVDGQGQPCAFPDPNNHGLPYFDADTLRFPRPSGTGDPAPGMVLPYLPDPLSRGATLRTLPGNPNDTLWQAWQTHQQPYALDGGRWHDARPFRLELFEQDPPAAPVFVEGVLRVGLPKAEVARVRLSESASTATVPSPGAPSRLTIRSIGTATLLTPSRRAPGSTTSPSARRTANIEFAPLGSRADTFSGCRQITGTAACGRC